MFSQPEIQRILEVFIYEQNRLQSDDAKYFRYIRQMNAIDLSQITVKDTDIIRGFLFAWGHMGRAGIKTAIPDTRTIIQRYAGFLQSLRGQALRTSNLVSHRKSIEDVFEDLNALVGAIAAGKTLHLICPDFFPLWDTPVTHAYDSSYYARHGSRFIWIGEGITRTGKPKEVITSTGYYNYMGITKSFVARYHRHLSEIQNVLNATQPNNPRKSLLKIVDEFNMHAAHIPFYYVV